MSLIRTISNFFTKQKQEEMEKTQNVVLTSYSQDHVLNCRMQEERLTHGQRVKADISPVRLEKNFGKTVMYFCPLNNINVKEVIDIGDGGRLPAEATLKGFEEVPDLPGGLYILKNITLYSNGTMQVIAGPDTVFEAV